jgi:hypothetical protein
MWWGIAGCIAGAVIVIMLVFVWPFIDYFINGGRR